MKRLNHVAIDAGALYQRCGRGLCSYCADGSGSALCDKCMFAQTSSDLGELYAGLLTSAILFAGVTWLFHTPHATHLPIANAAVIGLLAVFTSNGWQFLTRQLPSWWIGSGIVWLIYSTMKLFASFFIGVVVGPFQLIRSVYQLHGVRKLRRQIRMSRE